MKRLDTFLAEEFSEVRTKAELDADMDSPYDAEKLLEELKSKHKIDCSVGPCDAHYPPGLASARKRFESFLSKKRLGRFHSHRNNPNHPKVSHLSVSVGVCHTRATCLLHIWLLENKPIFGDFI